HLVAARVSHFLRGDKEVLAVSNGRRHVARLAVGEAVVPDHGGIADVARAVGPDAHEVVRGEAGGHTQDAVLEDEAGDELFRRPVNDPELFAGVRVVARNTLAAAQDQLVLAGSLDEQRRAVGAGPVRPLGAPALRPGRLVEGYEVAK